MPASPTSRHTHPSRPVLLGIGAALTLVIAVVVVVLAVSSGGPSSTQRVAPVPLPHPGPGPESMFTPASELNAADADTLVSTLQQLGVESVHIYMHWGDIAPDPSSRVRPNFDATDPAAYPAAGWAEYDPLVQAISAHRMTVNLALVPPPPHWASGRGAPHPSTQPEWKPNAVDYGQWVQAVATRYSGHYTPPGATQPLPRVSFWSIYNEPNLGFQLAPQAIDHSQVEVSARYYRALVDSAWTALQTTGHGHDTILIGELGPAGETSGAGPGNFNSMAPLRFLRALYCVDSAYRQLRGSAAAVRGCPTTAAASASFRADNPGLFEATGYADHPYSQGLPPDEATPNEPDFAELAAIGKLERVLDTLQRVYGSNKQFPIWSTEFGYQTTPPDPEAGTVTPAEAAYYLNWSEYLTWVDPRQRSYDQYLLTDPTNGYFATGLFTAAGAPKPGLYAYRMPLYLPYTATRLGHPLAVWGCVRPAPNAARSTHRTQTVKIELRAAGTAAYRTIETVPLTGPHGYFDIPVRFPASGEVRVAWTYPRGPEIFSRTVSVTLG